MIKTISKRLQSSISSQNTNKINQKIFAQYNEIYQESIQNPEQFWDKAANNIFWEKKYDRVWDPNAIYNKHNPNANWFENGRTNVSYNAIDRHAEADPNDIAIIASSDVTNTVRHITYADLQKQVQQVAGILAKNGVQPGDRVVIYMPMISETIVAMLACARIGAIHSVVFGGFAANELALRIQHAGAKMLITATAQWLKSRKKPALTETFS